MEVTLRYIEELPLRDDERAIFNVLKATLQYPANPQVKGEKLAEDINFFCNSSESGDDILWKVWPIVLTIVSCVPSGHLWQDSLVHALDSLRRRDGAVIKDNDMSLWEDLPDLSMAVREHWIDPTLFSSDPTEIGEELIEELARWKNLNSFIARFTGTGFPWRSFPIWQLRVALEEPQMKGPVMECRIWVASVWIIHCADILYEDMTSNEKLDEGTARSLRTGTLGNDIQPLSVERWEFWRKQFSELAANAGSLELGTDIIEKISDALKSMDAVKG